MRHDAAAPEPPGAGDFDISTLVDALAPVRPLRRRQGVMLAVLASMAVALAVALSMGVRADIAVGNPHWMFFVRGITLVALGVIAATAAVSTSQPGIGRAQPQAWKWVLAVAALFPLGAAYQWLSGPDQSAAYGQDVLNPRYGLECLSVSILSAMIVATALTAWMKRGAPASPERAGWLIGLASGALGAAAYSLHCGVNVLMYIGTWYTLAVGACAVAGRLILPRVLRW